jgi:hypothetical protein
MTSPLQHHTRARLSPPTVVCTACVLAAVGSAIVRRGRHPLGPYASTTTTCCRDLATARGAPGRRCADKERRAAWRGDGPREIARRLVTGPREARQVDHAARSQPCTSRGVRLPDFFGGIRIRRRGSRQRPGTLPHAAGASTAPVSDHVREHVGNDLRSGRGRGLVTSGTRSALELAAATRDVASGLRYLIASLGIVGETRPDAAAWFPAGGRVVQAGHRARHRAHGWRPDRPLTAPGDDSSPDRNPKDSKRRTPREAQGCERAAWPTWRAARGPVTSRRAISRGPSPPVIPISKVDDSARRREAESN